jgi:tetratricopeptide (TPR) repeat protein
MPTVDEVFQTAITVHQAGRIAEAAAGYERILAVAPKHADALHLLGVTRTQTGQPETAIDLIRRAIALNPGAAAYHNNLGGTLVEVRRYQEAIESLETALRLDPAMSGAMHNLAKALRLAGRVNEALVVAQRSVELEPQSASALNNLGTVRQELGQFAEARACFTRALQLEPQLAEAQQNMANVLRMQGHYDEALPYAEAAARLSPRWTAAWSNLGAVLSALGRVEAARASFAEALRLDPTYLEALANQAAVSQLLERFDEAWDLSRRALAIDPACVSAHFSLAQMLLMRGDFDAGWREYEWRLKLKPWEITPHQAPRWDGSPLAGRTLLVWDEQGLGDSIQFARFIPLIARQGGRIIVECHRPLAGLLRRLPDVAEVVVRGEVLPPFDLHVPLLSVPLVLGLGDQITSQQPAYLAPDPLRSAAWQRRLAGDDFKIGFVWRGRPSHQNDRLRSFRPEVLAPLAGLPGVRAYSLQLGARPEELTELSSRGSVENLAPELHELDDTAAVMRQLDLVVSCDSAPVHLAGALGTPVWVALPRGPDWRWRLERSDTPWYPSMRLFRQRVLGAWPGVAEQLETALGELLASR